MRPGPAPLLDTAGLAPSAAGARIEVTGGRLSVMDGPFTEAKELISYAIYDVASKEEAIQWTNRFMQLHIDLWPGWEGNADVLKVFGPEGASILTGMTSDRRTAPTADDVETVHRTITAVWRMESARLIGALARVTGDLGTAEELAQDALVVALERWLRSGVPPNPGGWLMTTARNRAVDRYRRDAVLRGKLQTVGNDQRVAELAEDDDAWADALDDYVGDDLLRLILTASHPVLPLEGQVALTLRCVTGLTTAELARAFLVPEATMGQRIVRAKKTLREHGVSFELPTEQESAQRLAAALEVIFLIFNEGYAVTSGTDWTRPDLCHEAIRLGRVLAGLVPGEPDVHGLLALMEIQASRLGACTDGSGQPLLLADQDRGRWDCSLIRRGLEALDRAQALPAPIGPYTLQAAIAACHARAASFAETDWAAISELYGLLRDVWSTPVVELNRAVAVGMASGPADGLAIVDELCASGSLEGYPLLAAVRGDLLARLGRDDEARAEFGRAASLTGNAGEQALFVRRAQPPGGSPDDD